MKKLAFYITAFILVLCFAVVPVCATETEKAKTEVITEAEVITETEAITETKTVTETETERKTETESKTETETKAETKDTWALIKSEFGADPQFWTVVILCAVMTVVTVFVCFVLLAKVNPTSRKSMNGMAKAIDIVKNIKEENSQTLAKIVEEDLFLREKILELENKLSRVESLDVKEKHNLFLALFNDLRIHKLVCDRLAMPVNDKSIIDLWYSQGIEAIKDDISEEDLAFINRISEKLNGVGKKK